MKKEDLLRLIDENVPAGADVEMTIATKYDNYTADKDQPVINEYRDGNCELVLELPDIFEVHLVEENKSHHITIEFDSVNKKVEVDVNCNGEQMMLAYMTLKQKIEEETGLPVDLAELMFAMGGKENDDS